MVYLHRLNTGEPVVSTPPVQQDKKVQQTPVKVVPVGQKTKKKSDDTDKLPQGYSIEKSHDDVTSGTKTDEQQKTDAQVKADTQQKNVKDVAPDEITNAENIDIEDSGDEPDSDLNLDERINIDDISLYHSDTIGAALEGAQVKGLTSAVEDASEAGDNITIDKAITMAKSDHYSVFENDFKKGVHGTGIVRYQISEYSNIPQSKNSRVDETDTTKRIDFQATYKSPKGNTKLMMYASGAKTTTNYSENFTNTPASDNTVKGTASASDVSEKNNSSTAQGPISATENNTQYNLYFGGQFNIANDELTACVLHTKGGEICDSKTTEIGAKYNIDKFGVTIDGNVIMYRAGNLKSTKTNLDCYLEAKDKKRPKTQTNDSSVETESEIDSSNEDKAKVQSSTGSKKWVRKDGLVLKGESIKGEYEQGIGYYQVYKRYDDNTFLKITPMIVASTTPRKEETSSYHATFGANVFYKNKINSHSEFDANLNVKDRISFCGADKGNIITAKLNANYSYKKYNAKIEGKYINSAETKYAALVLRNAYKANKNVRLFADVNLLTDSNELGRLNGRSVMVGANVSF